MDLNLNFKPDDERGVSPVIGVILMVAITVILAAVIGAFVLDLGSQLGSTGPQSNLASADSDVDSAPLPYATTNQGGPEKVLNIEHKGGDDLKAGEYEIQLTSPAGKTVTLTNGAWTDYDIDNDGTVETEIRSTVDISSTEFTVGDSLDIELREDGTGSLSADYDYSGDWTVKVIHKPSNSVVTSTQVEVS